MELGELCWCADAQLHIPDSLRWQQNNWKKKTGYSIIIQNKVWYAAKKIKTKNIIAQLGERQNNAQTTTKSPYIYI